MDVKPDFVPQHGYAFDTKKGQKRQVQIWTFDVVEPLKGSLKKGKKISFSSAGTNMQDHLQLMPMTCDLSLSFKSDFAYVVFLNKYHPKAYLKKDDNSFSEYKKIKEILKKK